MKWALVGVLVLAALAVAGCLDEQTEPAAEQAGPGGGSDPQEDEALGLAVTAPLLPIENTTRSAFDTLLCDPDCLVRITPPEAGYALEMDVAIDPHAPGSLLAVTMDRAYDRRCNPLVMHLSTDGGRTWDTAWSTPRDDVALLTEDAPCELDPVAAFGPDHVAYAAGFAASDIHVEMNGQVVYTRESTSWSGPSWSFRDYTDKPWLAVDPWNGTVYVVTKDGSLSTCGREYIVMRSHDEGRSWNGPWCLPLVNAIIRVDTQGTLHATGLSTALGDDEMHYSYSVDQGETWSDPRLIGKYVGGPTGFQLLSAGYRVQAMPSLGISPDGAVLASAWSTGDGDTGDIDVFLVVSRDGGGNWTEVPMAAQGHQFMPAVAVSPAGDVQTVYYDTGRDETERGRALDVIYRHLGPSGWDEPMLLTDEPFDPLLPTPPIGTGTSPLFVGDYHGLVASNSQAVAVFMTTHGGRPEMWAARIA